MIPLTPRFTREIRLGLVVYGGVSLAIYMNGVCREFYNAVRGRGVYKLIKALTDSDIVVDIISGTSAGGINGVLLAYALANSTQDDACDFQNFSGIWRESGNIDRLLRNPETRQNVDSFLNGEGFYQDKLTEAFDSFLTAGEKKESHDIANPKVKKDSEQWFSPDDDVVANPKDDWFSPFDELDLFVTGTDLLGKVTRQFDNTGKVIEVKQHEAVFLLKHRKGRDDKTEAKTGVYEYDYQYQPFKPLDNQVPQKALAKLCRITSCFPVAFPVVTVALDNKGQEDWGVDKRLIRWGKLADRILPKEKDEKPRELHFVDGGVLDNRPFGYTIGEIYRRHFTRPVDRHLFFIDPSPDTFIGSESFKAMARPDIWKTAVDSLVSLPRYESIAEDLKQIIAQNEHVKRYRFLRETAVQSVLGAIESQGRVNQPDSATEESAEFVYSSARLASMRDRLLRQLVGYEQVGGQDYENQQVGAQDHEKPYPQNPKQTMDKAARMLTSLIADPMDEKLRRDMLKKLSSTIKYIDVDYFIRKHLFVITRVVEAMKDSEQAPYYARLRLEGLAAYLNRLLSLLEVILSALDYLFSRPSIQKTFLDQVSGGDDSITARNKMYEYLIYLHKRLLDGNTADNPGRLLQDKIDLVKQNSMQTKAEDWLTVADVDTFYANLKRRADDIAATPFQGDDEKDRLLTLLQMSDACSLELMKSFDTSATQNEEPIKQLIDQKKGNFVNLFTNFDQIDQKLFPYEYLSGFHTEDLTKITRISPEDAKRGFGKRSPFRDEPKPIEERLAGIQLRAFGGFLKKSWRSNDMLWGRLDGLNRLVDTLLTPEALSHFPAYLRRHEVKVDDKDEIDRALNELLTAAFPQQAIDQKLQEKFFELAHCKDKQAVLHLLKNKKPYLLEEIKDIIVEAGQMAILQTDLNQVLLDTLSEQTDWNVQMVKPNFHGNDPPTPKFKSNQGYLEPSFSVFTTQALIKPEIERIFKTPEALKKYFTYDYRVGSERFLTHVPPLIREMLLTRMLLVFRAILNSPPTGATLQKSASYQLFGNLLQTYRLWVNTKNPANAALPPLLLRLVPWLGVALLVGALAYVVSQIPAPLLVASITLLLLQFLYSLVGSRSLVSQGLRALSLLVLAALLVSVTLGLPLPEAGGGLRLRSLVKDKPCPLISTPWATEKCAAR